MHELLKTQKSLMATMKEMAPVVEEGRKMMSQFGGYFGTKSVDSLAKTVKNFSEEQKKVNKFKLKVLFNEKVEH